MSIARVMLTPSARSKLLAATRIRPNPAAIADATIPRARLVTPQQVRELRNACSSHRARARRSGIPFLLTFDEWLAIWTESGHLHERGSRRGQYVMARHSDRGGFAVGNVKIITCSENTRKTHFGRRWSDEARQRLSAAHMGHAVSDATRRKLQAAATTNISDATRQKMSVSATARWARKRAATASG